MRLVDHEGPYTPRVSFPIPNVLNSKKKKKKTNAKKKRRRKPEEISFPKKDGNICE